ncbi:MAG: hypothetical protein Q9176_006153 [Flavoplaca citrina]
MEIPPDAQNTGSLREEPSGNGVKSFVPDPDPPTHTDSITAGITRPIQPPGRTAVSFGSFPIGENEWQTPCSRTAVLSAKPWSSQLSGGKGNRSRPNSRALERSQKQRDTSERLGPRNNFPPTTPRHLHPAMKDFNEGNTAATTKRFG